MASQNLIAEITIGDFEEYKSTELEAP